MLRGPRPIPSESYHRVTLKSLTGARGLRSPLSTLGVMAEKVVDAVAARVGAQGIEERLKLPSPPSLLTRLSGSGLMKLGSASRLRDMMALKREVKKNQL